VHAWKITKFAAYLPCIGRAHSQANNTELITHTTVLWKDDK